MNFWQYLSLSGEYQSIGVNFSIKLTIVDLINFQTDPNYERIRIDYWSIDLGQFKSLNFFIKLLSVLIFAKLTLTIPLLISNRSPLILLTWFFDLLCSPLLLMLLIHTNKNLRCLSLIECEILLYFFMNPILTFSTNLRLFC